MIEEYFDNGKFSRKHALRMIKLHRDYDTYRYIKRVKWFSPSEEFSLKSGVNIFKKWNLPFNLKDDDFQLIVLSCNDEILEELLIRTIELNKEINNIIESIEDLSIYDVLLGIASKFKDCDIVNFCNGGVGYKMRENLDWVYKAEACEKKVGAHLQFVPSCETLDYLYDELFK